MFLAIINDTYADVKTEIGVAPDELQMTQFVGRGFRNLLNKIGLKCPIKPTKKDESEKHDDTIKKIRDTLKKCLYIQLFNTAQWILF